MPVASFYSGLLSLSQISRRWHFVIPAKAGIQGWSGRLRNGRLLTWDRLWPFRRPSEPREDVIESDGD